MSNNPNTSMPLQQVLKRLKAAADLPFERAVPIPAALNHSREFLEHESEKIFRQEWVCICREDEVLKPGDFITHEIAEVPVVVIRQQNGNLGAFVNACAHRFACLIPQEKGSAKKFTCRYHGWTYDNSGQLIGAPHMQMKADFDKSQHRLRSLRLDTWQGFVYVSLAENPSTRLSQVLAPLSESVVGRYDMACYQTMIRETMSWNANWKNLIENFTESYHVPIAHGKTFAQHNKSLEDYICGEDSDYYGYHRAPQPLETGLGAAHPNNRRLEGEWRRMMVDFCIFPCHLVTLMPDYLWYITVQPEGTGQMRATWGVAFPPEVLEDIEPDQLETWLEDFKGYMNIANDEDKELVEALHSGTRSPLLPTGTFHPIERNLWQFNNYLARKCCR